MGSLIAWCGDSITAGSGASSSSHTFRAHALKTLGARMSASSIDAGIGGDRSDQLLARMPSVVAEGPGLVFVLVGTNDAGQDVPVATYQANIEAIRDAAGGIPVVFGLVPPRAAAGPATDLILRYNLWLRTWCHCNGIPCADTYGALADPASGLLASAYDSGDGTHPSNAGHAALAAAVADTLTPLLPLPTWPIVAAGGGMLADPLMAGTSAWSHLAYSTAGRLLVGGAGLPAGNWLRFSLTAGGGTAFAAYGTSLGAEGADWDEGDEILIAMHLRGSSAEAIEKIQLYDGSAIVSQIEESFPTAVPGPLLRARTIPAISGTLRLGLVVRAPAGQSVTVDVGACDVFDLTRLGLSGLEV